MTGPEAAALFYDEDRFTRTGVAPGWLKKTLFGKGGVQGTGSMQYNNLPVLADIGHPSTV